MTGRSKKGAGHARAQYVRHENVVYADFRNDLSYANQLCKLISEQAQEQVARKKRSRLRSMIDSIWELLLRTKPVDELVVESVEVGDKTEHCLESTKVFLDEENK